MNPLLGTREIGPEENSPEDFLGSFLTPESFDPARVMRALKLEEPELIATAREAPPAVRPDYYTSNPISRRWRANLAEMVRGLLPEGWESMKLLDAGVGDGYTIRLVKPRGEVVGIDTDPAMRDAAIGRGIDFRIGSTYNLPFPDECFDLVTCVEVLEHLESPLAGLAEVSRVLRPGGCAVISSPVPSVAWKAIWWGWTAFGPGRRWDNTPHVADVDLWSRSATSDGLGSMAKELGMRIEAVSRCNLGFVAGARVTKLSGQGLIPV